MSRGCAGEESLGRGCARRIMRLIGNWGRGNLIAGGGKRGGGLGGRMDGVIRVEIGVRHVLLLRLVGGSGIGVWGE